MSVDLSIGTRLPAYCTSMGRVLLAAPRAGGPRRVPACASSSSRTPPDDHRARAAAQGAGERGGRGYAIVDQELELGLRSIAVPVRDLSGPVVAAMNISTQASRVPVAELTRRFLPELVAAARDLQSLLL